MLGVTTTSGSTMRSSRDACVVVSTAGGGSTASGTPGGFAGATAGRSPMKRGRSRARPIRSSGTPSMAMAAKSRRPSSTWTNVARRDTQSDPVEAASPHNSCCGSGSTGPSDMIHGGSSSGSTSANAGAGAPSAAKKRQTAQGTWTHARDGNRWLMLVHRSEQAASFVFGDDFSKKVSAHPLFDWTHQVTRSTGRQFTRPTERRSRYAFEFGCGQTSLPKVERRPVCAEQFSFDERGQRHRRGLHR